MSHLFTLRWRIINNQRNQSIDDERKGARVFFNEYPWRCITIDFHFISACGCEKKIEHEKTTRKQTSLIVFLFFLLTLSLALCFSNAHVRVCTPLVSFVSRNSLLIVHLLWFIDRQLDSRYSLADHQLEWVKHFRVSRKKKGKKHRHCRRLI
jgi:hypothetical protein